MRAQQTHFLSDKFINRWTIKNPPSQITCGFLNFFVRALPQSLPKALILMELLISIFKYTPINTPTISMLHLLLS
jgi:hypothetical protein